MIDVPAFLGIDAPDEMPILELASRLAEKGYHLENTLGGDVRAVPIYDDKPQWDEVCSRGCGQRKRECICSLINHHED